MASYNIIVVLTLSNVSGVDDFQGKILLVNGLNPDVPAVPIA